MSEIATSEPEGGVTMAPGLLGPQWPSLDAPWLSLEMMAAHYVAQAVRACAGNKSAAARLLKIDRRSLYRWLAKGQR